jgi:Uma2 family endonuclease
MATATLSRKRKRKPPELDYQFGIESAGILMTPEEFDNAEYEDFDPAWDYELINGVLIVSPIPMKQETDPNEELGRRLRNFQEDHPNGKILNATLPEQYVRSGRNRRKADRVIWAGLGRLPRNNEKPTIIVEFVSSRKRDRERDYDTKRREYEKIKIKEYWIIDRFQRTMTAHILESGKFQTTVFQARQIYRTELLPGFELPISKLFALADRWDDTEETES